MGIILNIIKRLTIKHYLSLLISWFLFALWGVAAREVTLPIPILLIIVTISGFLALSFLKRSFIVKFNKTSFIISVILVFDLLLLLYSFKYVNFATVIGLHYLGPIIVTVMSPYILKEEINIKDILFSMIGFVGTLILLLHEFSLDVISTNQKLGVIAAFLSAFTLAGNVLYQRLYMKTSKNYIDAVKEYSFNMFLIYLIIILPLWIIFDIDNFTVNFNISLSYFNIFMAILAGISIQGLAMVLFNSSIRFIPAKNIAKMSYTEVIWVIVFGGVIYHETLYLLQSLGVLLILLSTFKGIKNEK